MLERKFQAIEAEWDDTYDRIRKTMQRIVKRAEVAEKLEAKNAATAGEDLAAGAAGNGAVDAFPGLTSSQRAIQQEILRKRARL